LLPRQWEKEHARIEGKVTEKKEEEPVSQLSSREDDGAIGRGREKGGNRKNRGGNQLEGDLERTKDS